MKELFLGAMATARASLVEALVDLDEAALTGVAIEGDWTAKDIVGHIAAYDESVLDAARKAHHGEAPVWGWDTAASMDAWNAAEVEKRRGLSLDQALAEFHAVRVALLAELTSWSAEIGPFGPNTWDEHQSEIGWLASHEIDHAAAVRSLRARTNHG
jgi:uncharacterized damage-inducible protein DinB